MSCELSGEHSQARVHLVVIDVGAVEFSLATFDVDTGTSVKQAPIVESNQIAGPERITHLKLVAAGKPRKFSKRSVRARHVGVIHIGKGANGMEGSKREPHTGRPVVD